MSTNHHTAISTGAAANAATINSPLAALDAALTTLDDRVDDIIAGSETSSTETVDARNSYTVLKDRIDDVNVRTTYFVDATFGANNATHRRYKTISGAIAAAAAGSRIVVAPGTYTEDVTFAQHDVEIVGSGAPSWDVSGNQLIGGTIIRGNVDCASKRAATLRDLGVDIHGDANGDAIRNSGSDVGNLTNQRFINLTVLGTWTGNGSVQGHGILQETGNGAEIRGCRIINCYHGVALRCSFARVVDCYFWGCGGTSIIVKADATSTYAHNNAITGCVVDGSSSDIYRRGGPIKLESLNASYSCRYNTVANCTLKNTGEAAVLLYASAGSCAYNVISNVISYTGCDADIRADFDAYNATDCHFINCISTGRKYGYGFRSKGTSTRIRVIGCISDTTGAGRWTTADTGTFDWIDVGAGYPIEVGYWDTTMRQDSTVTTQSMARSMQLSGKGTAVLASAREVLRLVRTGADGDTTVAVDIIFTSTSGGQCTTYQRRVAIKRPSSSTLVGAIATVGTDLASGAGAQGTLTVTLDLTTAETAKIMVQAASYDNVVYAYEARVVAAGSQYQWTVTNRAA